MIWYGDIQVNHVGIIFYWTLADTADTVTSLNWLWANLYNPVSDIGEINWSFEV